ncbi:MAG: MBL fold metallo-hydrolase [Burkholderiales bacterium]|nr:MAG: MBL fold metallo-hydrolase [Burkholderiales bacterium]
MPIWKFGPISLIPGGNRGRYPASNSVYVEGAGVLIDAGADAMAYRDLLAGPGVREVWLSHWHEDHLSHLDLLAGLPLRMMSADAPALSNIEAFLDAYGITREDHRDYWREVLPRDFHFQPRVPTAFFAPGEVIDLLTCHVEIIAAPGHTPGHTAFYFREPKVMFLADYDLTGFGPWYGDRDSSIELTLASLERLATYPAEVWLTSHEDGVFLGDASEAFAAYRGVIDQREGKLLEFLAQPRSMEEIVAACLVYRKPRDPKAFYEWGEGAIMGKHLERLLKSGQVLDEGGHYRRR